MGFFDPVYNWLMAYYELIRGLHILAVIAWMAGLLYLPRLFVYHTGGAPGSEMDQTFQTMERRLLKGIMNPAMWAAWILGLCLLDIRTANFRDPGLMLQPWLFTKLLGVVFQTGWHHFLAKAHKRFAKGANPRSASFWRAVNELPFLAAIVMVIAVTVEFQTWTPAVGLVLGVTAAEALLWWAVRRART
jgi:putative membrane protein